MLRKPGNEQRRKGVLPAHPAYVASELCDYAIQETEVLGPSDPVLLLTPVCDLLALHSSLYSSPLFVRDA